MQHRSDHSAIAPTRSLAFRRLLVVTVLSLSVALFLALSAVAVASHWSKVGVERSRVVQGRLTSDWLVANAGRFVWAWQSRAARFPQPYSGPTPTYRTVSGPASKQSIAFLPRRTADGAFEAIGCRYIVYPTPASVEARDFSIAAPTLLVMSIIPAAAMLLLLWRRGAERPGFEVATRG